LNELTVSEPRRSGARDVLRAFSGMARARAGLIPDLRVTGKRADPERIIVLVDGPNPSFDYFLAPRLADMPGRRIEICDTRVRQPDEVDPRGAFVVMCRYLPRLWQNWLRAHERDVSGMGLFLDDDFAALVADKNVPLVYRLRLCSRALVSWSWLSGRLNVLWVSSPELALRHASACPLVTGPAAQSVDLTHPSIAPAGQPLRIAFHATRSHLQEHQFAASLCQMLERERDDFVFDVIGGEQLRGLWAGRRAEISPPLAWPLYRARTAQAPAAIAISPLAHTRANLARGPTKAIDAVRSGAAGLFADAPAYRELAAVAPLVPFEVTAWRDALAALIGNAERRQANAQELRALVTSWRQRATPLFPFEGLPERNLQGSHLL